MMDGNVTPEYIDEPAYVDNGRYINVPPDMLEQNGGEAISPQSQNYLEPESELHRFVKW